MEERYPRTATPLRLLLAYTYIYLIRKTYDRVVRVAEELEKGTDVSWVDLTQQLARDLDVTTTIVHAYEKYPAFAATGNDYDDVDNEFWEDIMMSQQTYRYIFLNPCIDYQLDVCPMCNDISDNRDGTVYN